LLFQPAEELGWGALEMIADNCLEGLDATFALHMAADLPAGKVDVSEGPRLMAANYFKYRIDGSPGHGASPHLGVDAGLAMSACVMNLQSVVSREFSSLEPLVVTVGKMEAGTRFNVIASQAHFEGTVRTFDPGIFNAVPDVMTRIIKETAAAFRCTAEEVFTERLTVPCVNPHLAHTRATKTAIKLFGDDSIVSKPMSAGGEDYSFMMEKVPDSLVCWIGCNNPEKGACHPHHAGLFDIDEDVLVVAAAMYAQYAIDFLCEV